MIQVIIFDEFKFCQIKTIESNIKSKYCNSLHSKKSIFKFKTSKCFHDI